MTSAAMRQEIAQMVQYMRVLKRDSMTHFVNTVGYTHRETKQIMVVYVEWEDAGDKVVIVPDAVSRVIGLSVLRFDNLQAASRYLASRNAAIGSLTVVESRRRSCTKTCTYCCQWRVASFARRN